MHFIAFDDSECALTAKAEKVYEKIDKIMKECFKENEQAGSEFFVEKYDIYISWSPYEKEFSFFKEILEDRSYKESNLIRKKQLTTGKEYCCFHYHWFYSPHYKWFNVALPFEKLLTDELLRELEKE